MISPVSPQLLSVVLAESARVAHERRGEQNISHDTRAPVLARKL